MASAIDELDSDSALRRGHQQPRDRDRVANLRQAATDESNREDGTSGDVKHRRLSRRLGRLGVANDQVSISSYDGVVIGGDGPDIGTTVEGAASNRRHQAV